MRSLQSRSVALRVLPAVFGCIALVSAASEARSQATKYQYAAKYVCGVAPRPGTSGYGIVAPGTYFTSVNVHNPNQGGVEFRKKFVIALPNEQTGGRISDFFNVTLGADKAFEIECADILKHLDSKGPAKGFVVLLSPDPLDVVVVYTAAAAPAGPVVTMFMERVPNSP